MGICSRFQIKVSCATDKKKMYLENTDVENYKHSYKDWINNSSNLFKSISWHECNGLKWLSLSTNSAGRLNSLEEEAACVLMLIVYAFIA